MRRTITWVAVTAAATLLVAATSSAGTGRGETVEFAQAKLRVEINATDGDAGLQLDLDHDPWSSVRLRTPDGRVILDVRNRGVLRDYGLTELFSESSEPSFEEFPLSEFEKLFPEGTYVFEGTAVDGTRLQSTFDLTHDYPAGPVITSPEEDATVAPDGLVVAWEPVTESAGIEIVRYQVLVVSDDDDDRTLDLTVPAGVTSVAIPAEFLLPGNYKTEVLAIDVSGNQTLSEVAFTVG